MSPAVESPQPDFSSLDTDKTPPAYQHSDNDGTSHALNSDPRTAIMRNHITDEKVELTQEWLDFLLSPSHDTSVSEQDTRSVKRRKLRNDSPSIPVLQASLDITCRGSLEASTEITTVDETVALTWHPRSHYGIDRLALVCHSNRLPWIKFYISETFEFTDELELILDIIWYKHTSLAENRALGRTHRLQIIRPSDVDQFQVETKLRFSPAGPGRITIQASYELRWHENRLFGKGSTAASKLIRDALLELMKPDDPSLWSPKRCSPQDFYHAALATDGEDKRTLHIDGLASMPYPFQQRAIRWLLHREGVQWVDDIGEGNPGPLPTTESTMTPEASHTHLFKDLDGLDFYFNNVSGLVSRDKAPINTWESDVRGGILAEEMGLGKTVEIIALVLLHRRPKSPATVADPYLRANVRPTSGTLIVTPPALLHQWVAELQQHAPHLSVLVYEGVGKSCQDPDAEAEVVTQLAAHDIVVTTYSTLSKEIHFAIDPPQRPRRGERKYHRPKSPLIQLSWWRVCLDEAQLVDSGVSAAATLARIIPRVNAWAVTGTPVKDDIKDLWGLLLFLRYEPYASYQKVWSELIDKPRAFHALFNTIALRHSKRLVRSELELPGQTRYVITVPLSAVEEQWYAAMLRSLTERCGLTPQGEPLSESWDPTETWVIEAMKTALDRLRKTALHPTTIPGGPAGLGKVVAGPMRTVAEVLDTMIEQSQATAATSKRAYLSGRLTQGQFFENSPRVKEALALWEDALRESDDLVAQGRQRLRLQIASANDVAASNDDGFEVPDEEADFETASAQVFEAQRTLRFALEVQHRAVFLVASAHFQIRSNTEMTEPDSDEFRRLEKLETDGYDRAKVIRNEILQETRSKAMRVMEKISRRPSSKTTQLFLEHRPKDPGGIRLSSVTEKIDLLGEKLNDQAHFINLWREKAIELALKELVDQDDSEVTGEEFAYSTQVQEELMVYITVLRVAVQDRKAALVGHASTYVAEDEVRRAQQQAENDIGPSPAKMLEVLARRGATRPPKELSCIQALVTELRDIGLRLKRESGWRGGPEVNSPEELIVQAETARIQSYLDKQVKALATINQDLLDLTSGMNTRIEYYRQLQAISDTVAPYEGRTDEEALTLLQKESDKLAKKAATAESQHRYLLTLKANDQGEESHMCIICQELFSVSVLTVCGHAYCKDCLSEWFKMKRTCPQCKRPLSRDDLHDIALKPQEFGFHLEDSNRPNTGQWKQDPKESTIYKMFNDQSLADIRNIVLPGTPLTAKTAMIVKHLIWLRTADPGAKTIIFSQYPSFLETLSNAFGRHNITFTSFNDRNGIRNFKEDLGIECFLLHARAHASGLNLVNASHVVLCEPLLNTALELQAIARVHRIGQRRATTVWLYIVDGTVEESVYTLSVRRRMRHVEDVRKNGDQGVDQPASQDESLEISNTEEIEKAKLSSLMMKRRGGEEYGGEAVANEDLYECLFGKPLSAIEGNAPAVNEPHIGLNGIRDVPLVRRHLLGEAAEERRDNGEGSSRQADRGYYVQVFGVNGARYDDA